MLVKWFEYRQVYAPSRLMVGQAQDIRTDAKEVWLRSADGVRLQGWHFPALPGAAHSHRAILFLHGNAGNMSTRLKYYGALLEAGCAVFTLDYRGYGLSEGSPSEAGTYLDAQAGVRWLEGNGYAPGSVVALGESLGGGVASELAVRESLAGLILFNTFTSIPDLGGEMFPWLPVHRLGRIKYDTRSKLSRVQEPVLIMHSPADRLIGFHHGQANFAAAREPKMFWELRGDHTEALEADRARFVRGIQEFLTMSAKPSSAPVAPAQRCPAS